MSELISARDNRTNFRRQLLTTASALALLGSMYAAGEARAADSGDSRPTLWIELGGQLSRSDDAQEPFTQDFPNSPPRPSIFSPSPKFEKPPLYSIDETGQISFEPSGTNWVFSASVDYGRSSGKRDISQQTNPEPFTKYTSQGANVRFPLASKFADTAVHDSEHHLVLDFQAGKDVGLGMFGTRGGSSVFDIGVRFAQFGSRSNIALKSDPDWHFHYKYVPTLLNYGYRSSKIAPKQIYHTNRAEFEAARSFHGVGPSISWKAAAPVAGNSQGGELSFDWGMNGALLFGRQRMKLHHQATGQYHSGGAGFVSHPSRTGGIVTYHPTPVNVHRTKTLIVPNIGGFAGASWRIQNFKVSLGYRADLFFGAMDGGIDAAKKENVGFYGPFASVSVGLGG
jgi:hypothetical protein